MSRQMIRTKSNEIYSRNAMNANISYKGHINGNSSVVRCCWCYEFIDIEFLILYNLLTGGGPFAMNE